VLVVRRELVRNVVPTTPGGGTVAFVTPGGHRYLDDPVAREEGGTPAIVESVGAGLVLGLKQAVGAELIQECEEQHWRTALARWQHNPAIDILGSHRARRLPIISFLVRHADRYLHHNYVVALLNDLFGIQARGGCSCAGPYGHRLLALDNAASQAFQNEITHGCDGIKPGWVRVNFAYFLTPTVRDYLIDAVDLVARLGHRMLPDYRFDPQSGGWRHRNAPARPPLSLTAVRYTPDGGLTVEDPRRTAGEGALADQFADAVRLLMSRPEPTHEATTRLPATVERIRWFTLPHACLSLD
jgi:hypothetical protein